MKKLTALFCIIPLIVLLFGTPQTVGAQEYIQHYESTADSDSFAVEAVPKIKGIWKGKWTSKTGWYGDLRLLIKQNGSKIWGIMDVTNTDCGNYDDISFTGKIDGNIVSFKASTWCGDHRVAIKFAKAKIANGVIKGKYVITVDGDVYDSGAFSIKRK